LGKPSPEAKPPREEPHAIVERRDAASLRDRHEAGVIARRFQAAAASGEMRSFRERVPAAV
jgi:hypothetical protein